MLHLAEVQKRGTFISTRTELKLLACQRTDQTWVALAGDEIIQADEASHFGAGALLLVDLTPQKQIQRVQDAARPLVSILQNLSRLREKSKQKEEEIEQWNQSLTYQSQELTRRTMELEDIRTENEQLRAELERQKQELEQAWTDLRSHQAEVGVTPAAPSSEQASGLQAILGLISDTLPGNLQFGLRTAAQLQERLDQLKRQFEEYRAQAERLQGEVDRKEQELNQRRQDWQQTQQTLEATQADLKVQQQTLKLREEETHRLRVLLQHYDTLHQQVHCLMYRPGITISSSKVDLQTLDQMPLDQLRETVQDLQQDLLKISQFVSDQEEELRSQQEVIEELTAKIEQASEFDRLSLETDLADERVRYRMLDETLIGQRRILSERQAILQQYETVLSRREGRATVARNSTVDLSAVLAEFDAQRQQQTEELQRLEHDLEQRRTAIQQIQGDLDQQLRDQATEQNAIRQLESELLDQQLSVVELQGKVSVCQETLQPLQEGLSTLQQELGVMANLLSQLRQPDGQPA